LGRIITYVQDPASTFPKFFDLDKTEFKGESLELGTEALEQVRKVSNLMQQFEGMEITISVETSIGRSNMEDKERKKMKREWHKIGRKRAKLIKEIISKNGVAKNRISTRHEFIDKGPDNPSWKTQIVIENL